MSKINAVIIFAILCFTFGSLTSCAEAVNNTAENSNNTIVQTKTSAANEDKDQLTMLIKLPDEVTECVWLETKKGTGKQVTAVLRFSAANTAKLVAELSKEGQPAAATIEPEEWFPTELTTQNEMTGNEGLPGKAYSAASFVQFPYLTGRVVHIDDTDFFIVEMTAESPS